PLLLVAQRNDVVDARDAPQARRVPLGVAAGGDEERSWIGAAQPACDLARLAVGVGGDRAGVQDDDVGPRGGVFLPGRAPQPQEAKARLERSRVGLLQLAAESDAA